MTLLMDSTILASLIGAAATIAAASITFYATRMSMRRNILSNSTPTVCQFLVLSSRIEVFNRARALISGAKHSVVDTTWGTSEENYTKAEHEALDLYLKAKNRAITDGEVSYREIYSAVSGDQHREWRIEDERVRKQAAKAYSAKLLKGIDSTLTMIDFLVVDGEEVILACLSKDTAKPEHHYLYVKSFELAGFLLQYFQICWEQATLLTVQPSSSSHFISESTT
jgi:hypothetical protein